MTTNTTAALDKAQRKSTVNKIVFRLALHITGAALGFLAAQAYARYTK